MAGITSKAYNTVKLYWRRRYYHRIEPVAKPVKIARFGTAHRSQKSRPVQLLFKLRVKTFSPCKLLAKARDTYMNLMLALAGGECRSLAALKSNKSCIDEIWVRRVSKSRQMSISGQSEFEKRMMVHIYNLLVARPELPGAPKMMSVAA